jgi:transcriptional accessory protein Tex/SPT6
VGRRFHIGDVVPDCKIELIDVENGRVSCTVEDPDEVVKDLEPKPRVSKAKGKAAPARQSQAIATLPKAKAKAKAKAPAAQGATSIERLRVGQLVNGVVSNKGPYGVFVDIGVGKDAKLLIPKKMIPSIKRKEEIYDMRVESVDLEKVLIAVALDNPELSDQQVVPRVSSAAGKKAAAKPKAKPKAKANPNALPVSSFRVGQECNGVVTNIGPQGVFVDIRCERDAILKLPREVAKQFRINDEVHGMTIEAIDLDDARITLLLEDPELKEPMPPPRKALATRPEAKRASSAPPTSKAKSQPKAKPSAKAKGGGGKDWSHNTGTPLEELVVGSEVNGVVTNRGTFGVFLDIGAVKDGKLQLPKNAWRKFRKGDEVEEMIIENVDLETESIALALTYELGDEPEEYVEPMPEVQPKPKAKSAASRQQPQALTNGSAKAAARPASRSSAPARTGAAKSKARARG